MTYEQLCWASDTRRKPLDVILEIGAAVTQADVIAAWSLALAMIAGIALLFAMR